MSLFKTSLIAACVSVIFLGAIVANAVLAPMPAKIGAWTTVVITY